MLTRVPPVVAAAEKYIVPMVTVVVVLVPLNVESDTEHDAAFVVLNDTEPKLPL